MVLAAAVALSPGSTQAQRTARRLVYPASPRGPVVDTIFGTPVPDPYRWLEDDTSTATRQWTEQQNALTARVLGAAPGREVIHARLEQLLSIGTVGVPQPKGNHYFFTRREGTQNQPILYVREGLSGPERALVDVNALNPDGTTAMDWWYPSPGGRYLAYGISQSGSERATLHVREVATGQDLPDTIPDCRFASVAWLPDNSGFYYTRFPHPGTVPAGEEHYNQRVRFHRLGTDPAGDDSIFGRQRYREETYGVQLSPDGRWLLVTAGRTFYANDLYLKDRQSGGPWVTVVENIDANFGADLLNDKLYVTTNQDAPNFELYVADVTNPSRTAWRELVAERADAVLEGGSVIAGRLFLQYLRNASDRLEIRALDGSLVREVELPTLGTLSGLGGEWDGREAFFGFASYTVPPSVYHLDLASGAAETPALWRRVEAPINPDQFEVKQVWYASKDGTNVSMFIVHRRGLQLNGRNPTVLNGYGGFQISLTPSFSRGNLLWLESGGVLAIPNLRGGGEYGERWHQAGMQGRKQNVFDDFVAAAEWLIRNRYTNPQKLAISGGSNGGLLTGAMVTQRPDLFRAALVAVPLLDMIRYHRFLIARFWIPEYGSSEDSTQFPFLHAYSPYHHVRNGVRYPAVLLTAAESDSRVAPLHARKMAARLQEATAGDRPILVRIETRAGHGAGKPRSKQVDEQTDIWSFFFSELGVRR
ncbi:MAG: S9 family peptidase [Gemmatimonadetes bacterium]|nr:S9 family peptidase [Gemmatimonadota bacterium]